MIACWELDPSSFGLGIVTMCLLACIVILWSK